MRPSWDDYFCIIADAVSLRSDCVRRKVGAVIYKDNRIMATGYNGAPAGKPGCDSCPRSQHARLPKSRHYAYDSGFRFNCGFCGDEWPCKGLNRETSPGCRCGGPWPCPDAAEPGSSYDTGPNACVALHAEQNALLYADYEKCADATIAITDSPCDGCRKLIEGAKIARIIIARPEHRVYSRSLT